MWRNTYERRKSIYTDFWAEAGRIYFPYRSDWKIINTFDMENPSNMVYMIAGVRGSGKTVSLAVIGDHYNAKETGSYCV